MNQEQLFAELAALNNDVDDVLCSVDYEEPQSMRDGATEVRQLLLSMMRLLKRAEADDARWTL